MPAYRADELLAGCVRSVLDQDLDVPFEVIVVASADRADELPRLAPDPRLRVLTRIPRLGPAQARNVGAEAARGRSLAFIDVRARAPRGWLRTMLAASGGERVVGGAVRNANPASPVSAVEYLVEFIDLHPSRPPPAARHGAGCNLLVPRELWGRYGPWPDLRAAEDVVLTARVRADGLYRFVPEAPVDRIGRTRWRDMVGHQFVIGRYVAHAGRMAPHKLRPLVRYSPLAPVATLFRLASIYARVVAWMRRDLLRACLLVPLVIIAVAMWGSGLLVEGLRLDLIRTDPSDPRPLALKRPRLVVPAVTMVAVSGLGLYRLGRESFWVDEGITAAVVTGSWKRYVETSVTFDPNDGLYHFLLRLWSILGTSEFALRSFSVLCVTATVPVLFRLGERLFGTRTGQIAVVLFAVNAFVIRFAQEARAYAFALFLVAGVTLLLTRALDQPTTSRWAVWAIGVSVLVYAHALAVTTALAHGMATLAHRHRPRWRTLMLAAGTAGVLIAPLAYVFGRFGPPPTDWIPATTARAVWATAIRLAGGQRLLLALYAVAVLLALARPPRRWHWPLLLCGLVLAAPFALVLGVSVVKPLFISRYLIVALPGLFLLAGAGLSRLRAGAAAIATTLFVAASMPVLAGRYTSENKADWRGAAALVRRSAGPSEVVVVGRVGVPVFRHYEDERPVYAGHEVIDGLAPIDGRSVWLVLPDPERLDHAQVIDPVSAGRRLVQRWSFNLLELRLYRPSGNVTNDLARVDRARPDGRT